MSADASLQSTTERRPRYSPTTSAPMRTKVGRLLTAPFRVRPDFVIIGAQRCGTTSLFEYLQQHPQVLPGLYKEVRYFTYRWWLGPLYYRACFPTKLEMRRARAKGPAMTFEATPSYMFSPLAMSRLRRVLPDVKLVAILRDPVQRALSHYRRSVRLGHETLTFEEAIAAEPERLARKAGECDHHYENRPDVRRFSYVSRGLYAKQLRSVIDLFGRESLHVMCFESLVQEPRTHFDQLLRFLGLDPGVEIRFSPHHQGTGERPDISPEASRHLEEIFAPDKAALREEFGDRFPWACEGD